MRTLVWALLGPVPRKAQLPLSTTLSIPVLQKPHRRNFHAIHRKRARDDQGPERPSNEHENTNTTAVTAADPSIQQALSNGSDNGWDGGPEPSKPKDLSNYGSAIRRSKRNRLPKELPPVYIPQWFLKRNITLAEENAHVHPEDGILASTTKSSLRQNANLNISDGERHGEGPSAAGEESLAVTNKGNPELLDLNTPESVLLEIMTMIKAGLRLQSQIGGDAPSNKCDFVLCCPRQGASRYLRELVMNCSSVSPQGIDFVRLDAHDIAEIGSAYIDDNGALEPNSFGSLSYDALVTPGQVGSRGLDEPADDEEMEEDEEGFPPPDESGPSFPRKFSPLSTRTGTLDVGVGVIPIGSIIGNVQESLRTLGVPGNSPNPKNFVVKMPREGNDNSHDLKLGLLVDTVLSTPDMKRNTSCEVTSGSILRPMPDTYGVEIAPANDESTSDSSQRTTKDLIVLIEDYPQINRLALGNAFLNKLHEVADAKRKDGQRVLVVGTASTHDVLPFRSRAGIKQAQAEPQGGPTRTIIVPVKEKLSSQVFDQEQSRKIRASNLRHLRNMLRIMTPSSDQVHSLVENWDLEIDRKASFLVDMDENIWSMDFVDRIATMALGQRSPSGNLTVQDIETAMNIISDSDETKRAWLKTERQIDDVKKTGDSGQAEAEEKIQKLRRKCNRYEKKLLNGVIDPANIRTTFTDVKAPSETIEALKTLTSLSLIRPDAFKYGVLATNRIPGLLLYGPPGTGKTLLAKAVAKESGATVLEVSGSDVYDMYVGEGEKNVRAVFSLAKKLAPCVVFIDEADAILGTRGGSSNRGSHRELINQFLREWDGMTDFNAFIMVATNRPFDLDEASLRRLPRRLLVDLPTAEDREAILKIHLRDEKLDPEVSLTKLASETPYYSGSDLKNLCVAAALACVREEMGMASADTTFNTPSSDDVKTKSYPEKRTLALRHFTKATEEISASISEDMRSLSAIRKFDEKYGDRKGRRKKLSSYGFKTVVQDEKVSSDNARVRNR